MPVTRSRTYLADLSLDNGLDGNNTTGFLFGDEDSNLGEVKTYTQAGISDNFPTLVRREGFPNMVLPNGWANVNRHRHQQSLSTIGSSQLNGSTPVGSGQPAEVSTIGSRPSNLRHSLDLKYFPETIATTADTTAPIVSPSSSHIMATPPKLQQSFSANDVPTVKNGNGTPTASLPSSTANNHAQQHFHNHNASLGRIPAGAMPNRHSREMSSDNGLAHTREPSAYPSIGSALQASATPFGPPNQAQPSASAPTPTPATAAAASNLPYPFYNGAANFNGPNGPNGTGPGYGVPMLAMTMQGLSLSGNNSPMYSPHNYTGYNPLYNQHPRTPQDSQARVIQNRRQMDNEAMSRFVNLPLESVGGTIYQLCKDQHGCRYLQKQLENRLPDQIHMIWLETNQHVVELMTDPFGNYLCQKLLEYCNDEERTVLIQNAAQDMVRIALNQHGTRALQKMIEFVSSPTQVEIIVDALRFRVVELIQDLNGNHVIQKCLNKLSPNDAQFIFDAVGTNCVDVGTHRHGCCVLQRCIDHASGDQKSWLIQKITENAVALVQDPFGNYVVQYIIDLNEPSFTEPLVAMFHGRIGSLSRHKFSSNVVEKCLRCAQDPSKDMIAEELLAPGEIDRLLRDSFANYVIQTALEYSTHYMKHRLVESIRPSLPGIRSTPYGRRIQAKVQAYDNRGGASTSGQATPADNAQGQVPLRPGHNRAMSNNTSILTPNGYTNGINGTPSRGGAGGGPNYPSSSVLTVPPPSQSQQRASQFQQGFVRSGVTAEGGESQWL